ncbi:hypothetical protein [Alicyclobacillus sp. SP_1]|uniref:hypothetical protein n=1 Tax=Alicyclobacillus sp. SP_1 TaxID=2942475 RepID=UPI0021581B93|nr:hypothetical protein [Alicyclobacillus sp. SP_1]
MKRPITVVCCALCGKHLARRHAWNDQNGHLYCSATCLNHRLWFTPEALEALRK